MISTYLFGDTDLAASRLELLADVFDATSRPFLTRAVAGRRVNKAVDLGCGPGRTSRLLAESGRCREVVGLDNSEHFVSLAKASAGPGVSFGRHDVTVTPFPSGQADLIYCRFLLAHQTDPARLIEQWATQLCPGGLLVAEEPEWVQSDEPAFRKYLEMVEAMLASQGHTLYVGRHLAGAAAPAPLTLRSSQVATLAVSSSQAARMFYMNMQTWKADPFVKSHFYETMVERVENDLHGLAESAPCDGPYVQWGIRQLIFERTGTEQN